MVNITVGSLATKLAEGTTVCPFEAKKSVKDKRKVSDSMLLRCLD